MIRAGNKKSDRWGKIAMVVNAAAHRFRSETKDVVERFVSNETITV